MSSYLKLASALLILSFSCSTFASSTDEVEFRKLNTIYSNLLANAPTQYDRAKTLVRYSRKADNYTNVEELLNQALRTFQSMEKHIEVQAYPLLGVSDDELLDMDAFLSFVRDSEVLKKRDLEQSLAKQKLANLYLDMAEVLTMLGNRKHAEEFIFKAAWQYIESSYGKQPYLITSLLEMAEDVLGMDDHYARSKARLRDWAAELFENGEIDKVLRIYDLFWLSKGKEIDPQDLIQATYYAYMGDRETEASLYYTYLSNIVEEDNSILSDARLTHPDRMARLINYDMMGKLLTGSDSPRDKVLSQRWQNAMGRLRLVEPVTTLFGEVPLRILDRKDSTALYYFVRNLTKVKVE